MDSMDYFPPLSPDENIGHMMEAAEYIATHDDLSRIEFNPRIILDQYKAIRHLTAVKATQRISPADKRLAIAHLLALWYHTVSVPKERNNA